MTDELEPNELVLVDEGLGSHMCWDGVSEVPSLPNPSGLRRCCRLWTLNPGPRDMDII